MKKSFINATSIVAMSLSSLWTGCSRSNNLILGEVTAELGSHQVKVTDCYRTRVPNPSLAGTRLIWEPCRDARILIAGQQLSVNGTDYGTLQSGDDVLVDHGVVSIRPASSQDAASVGFDRIQL